MLVAWPWVIGHRPSGAGHALAAYSLRFGIYFLVMLFVWVAVAICALMVARRAREDYQLQVRENLEGLIEAALRDHKDDPKAGNEQ
jgi:hypothetical protein